MSKKIKVRCKQHPQMEGCTRLRKLGGGILYWTHEPEMVDPDNPEVRRRLHLGLLEVVPMVDIPKNPRLTKDNPCPDDGGEE